MKPIPSALQRQFESLLKNNDISGRSHGAYKKWLQYYLDFCQKYDFKKLDKGSLPHFINKLKGEKSK